MKIFTIAAMIILIVHGLIHLIGTVTYLKLGTVQGLAYKSTLLGGHWNLGEAGMRVYGVLWGVAAIGFLVAALALLAGWEWRRPALLGVAVFSLAITALSGKDAFAGAVVNVLILIVLALAPTITKWTVR